MIDPSSQNANRETNDTLQLIGRVRAGDADAERSLFDRHLQRLLAAARLMLGNRLRRRVDAEDVLMSVYRSFFLGLRADAFRFERSGDLWRLLLAMTRNKVRSQVERHTAGRRAVGKETPFSDAAGAGLADALPSHEEVAALCDELARFAQSLDGRRREVLELRLQECSIEEIAKRIDCSQRTVRRWLNELRSALEAQLNGEPTI